MFFVVLLPPAIPQAITRHTEFNQHRTLITPHSSELDAAKSDICNKQMAVAMPGPFCTSGQIYSIQYTAGAKPSSAYTPLLQYIT